MTSLIKKLKIGKLVLRNNLVLSPMAGITNYAFRKICLESGCGLAVSEMVSSESVSHGNKKSLEMLLVRDDRPAAVQIFGSKPDAMLYTALKAEESGADLIEINASCPVKKVTKTGAGASLMKTPELLAEITAVIAKKIKIPLSVKIRSGWTDDEPLAPELAGIIQDAGADMLHVHLRSVARIHSGEANFPTGAEIRKRIKIPFIANGGVTSPEKALELFKKTGCDGISIGRGAVTNPLIFSEIEDFLTKGRISAGATSLRLIKCRGQCHPASGAKGAGVERSDTIQPFPQDCDDGRNKDTGRQKRLELFFEFLKLNCETIGEEKGLKTSRKLIGLWLKNFPNAAALRSGFMKVKSLSEAKELLKLEK